MLYHIALSLAHMFFLNRGLTEIKIDFLFICISSFPYTHEVPGPKVAKLLAVVLKLNVSAGFKDPVNHCCVCT